MQKETNQKTQELRKAGKGDSLKWLETQREGTDWIWNVNLFKLRVTRWTNHPGHIRKRPNRYL